MSQATHLFLDIPPEPDPEEPGLYWAARFTDALKTFRFLPDRLYENIDTTRTGEKISRADVCGDNNRNCPALTQKTYIIGKLKISKIYYRLNRNLSEDLISALLARLLSSLKLCFVINTSRSDIM